MEHTILTYLKEHEAEIFEDLRLLVSAEADSADVKGLAEVRQVLEQLIRERSGVEPHIYKSGGGHDSIGFTYGEGKEKILLLGHYDTVHPKGAVKTYTEGNRFYGPGIVDMKGGLVASIWAAKAFRDLGIYPGKRLEYLFNSDEEIGSLESRELICRTAEGARAALVCEPPMANGDLKTGRKGIELFDVTIHGKSAHAGNASTEGIHALEEMARELLFMQGLTDLKKGTTVNVGVCSGGSARNIIPDRAVLQAESRFLTVEEQRRVKEAICSLPTSVAGASREVRVAGSKPPMEQTAGNLALFEIAKGCGEKLGLTFSHQTAGGNSDGNLVSAMGIPTLDGLGAWGDGMHSLEEYILMDQYIPRAALLASVMLHI